MFLRSWQRKRWRGSALSPALRCESPGRARRGPTCQRESCCVATTVSSRPSSCVGSHENASASCPTRSRADTASRSAGQSSWPTAWKRTWPSCKRQSQCTRMEALRALDSRARTVVLVEGISDQRALEALARRRGRRLDAERISIVPIGGAQAIGNFLARLGRRELDLKLAGLCDAAEEGDFQRGLERAGLGSDLTRAEMERRGFYVCVEDLEEELIRAVGAARVEEVVEAQGDLQPFRTLQKQPAWRDRPLEEQLRRFMGSGGRRKIRYARLLVETVDLTRVPRPLDL